MSEIECPICRNFHFGACARCVHSDEITDLRRQLADAENRARIADEQCEDMTSKAADMAAMLAAMTERAEKAEADAAETDTSNTRLHEILKAVAKALKPPPKPLTMHSWHDLGEVAEKLRADAAVLARECRASREWHERGGEDPVTSEITYKAWIDSMHATDASGALARGEGEKT